MRRCYGLTVTTRPRTRAQRRPIRSRMFDHGARPSATTSRRVSLLLQYLFGPMRLTDTVKKGTTMVISTLNFLLTRGVLRRGDGLVSTPDASAAAPSGSLGSQGSAGRMSLASAGVKLETLAGPGYDACGDTCIKAFVRRMAAAATAP